MIQILKDLQNLGFSPVSSLLLLGILAVWRWAAVRDRKGEDAMQAQLAAQDRYREAWHADTRAQVDEVKVEAKELRGHVEECNEDRVKLSKKIGTLETDVARMKACPHVECPVRRS